MLNMLCNIQVNNTILGNLTSVNKNEMNERASWRRHSPATPLIMQLRASAVITLTKREVIQGSAAGPIGTLKDILEIGNYPLRFSGVVREGCVLIGGRVMTP